MFGFIRMMPIYMNWDMDEEQRDTALHDIEVIVFRKGV